jgi:hypothetical protein
MRILTFAVAVVVTVAQASDLLAQRSALATYRLGQGWATFGLALPQGAARDGVVVGNLETQTDVKTKWEDGSIRFAIVTAQVRDDGTYPISGGAPTARTATPSSWPNASVELVIGPTKYVAVSPKAPTSDVWLSGPQVHEARALVTPMADGSPHPSLRIRYDVRSYAGGGQRLSVSVENIVDVPETNMVTYAVTVRADGAVLYTRPSVAHHAFSRWRQVFRLNGLQESEIVPDFTPFHQSKAIPEYLSTAADAARGISGPKFDILQIGDLTYPMGSAGGRPEFGPYPAWVASYVAHKQSAVRDYLLKSGENVSGAWSIHITNPDDTSITVDQSPNWTWAAATPGPRNKKVGRKYDAELGTAHQPSLAYIPYLLTGDRFYLDEMRHWAHWVLTSYLWGRNGAQGLITSQHARAIAWGLRDLADFAAYAPDNDRDRPYIVDKVKNNLRSLDVRASEETVRDPLGSTYRTSGYLPKSTVPSQVPGWQSNYLAWSIHRAVSHGFGPEGSAMRDRLVKYQLALFTSAPDYNPNDAVHYWHHAVRHEDGTPFKTFGELWTYNFGGEKPRIAPAKSLLPGYLVDARLALLVALDLKLPGAQQAYDMAMRAVHAANPGYSAVDALRERSEFALKTAAGSGTAQLPSPGNLRIVR